MRNQYDSFPVRYLLLFNLVGKGVSEHGCLCLLISKLVSKRKQYESLSVFKPAHLRSDNPTAETEAKKESQVAEEDNEVIKQLKKTQANISIWGLLMASKSHRDPVLQGQTHVSLDTSPSQLVQIISHIRMANTITFTDKDLPKENHNKALHITVITTGKRVPMVLVDNGSALNVCPFRTATCLGYQQKDFAVLGQAIRAYDNTRREVMGIPALEFTAGPVLFKDQFQVLDIPASFNLLLGRPWIHAIEAVPSTLHQKVKFIQGNHVISIFGDPEEPVLDPIPVLEIQHDENLELAGFQFEQVQVIELAEPVKKYLPLPDFSENFFVREMFRSMRHLHGSGLGRRHQEIVEPIHVQAIEPPFWLGCIYLRKKISKNWKTRRRKRRRRG